MAGGRTLAGSIATLLALLSAGCYSYLPAPPVPEPGMRVALELNDQGRVGLANHLGPEAARVEGGLVGWTDSQYVVQVSDVIGLQGTRTRWSGETVTLRPEYVKSLRERRFSWAKTALLSSALTGALVAFIATRSLLGQGPSGGETQPPGPGENH